MYGSSLKSGERAFDQLFSGSYFDYFVWTPGSNAIFNEPMTGRTMQIADTVVTA